MVVSPLSYEERFLALAKSLATHLTIFLFVWIGVRVKELSFFQNQPVVTIKSAVKVDILAMPKLTLKELKAIPKINQQPVLGEKAEEPTQKIVDEGHDKAPVLADEQVKKEKSFDDFLNKLSEKKINVKKVQKKGNPDAQVVGEDQEKIQELLHLGNRLAKGLVTFGESDGEEVQGELVDYGTSVIEKIRSFWRLPTYLMNQNLKCGVQIYLDGQGRIIRTYLHESSGTPEYDQRAVTAIQEASPFAIPPASLVESLRRGSLVIGFPL